MPLARGVPSSLDTTPGKEGLKQAVTGTAFVPQFRTTYENNVVYNLLLEKIMPELQRMTVAEVKSAAGLVRQLTALSQRIPRLQLAHTPQSLFMLDVIMKKPGEKLRQAVESYRKGMRASAGQPISPYNPRVLKELEQQQAEFEAYRQRFLKLQISQKIRDENVRRLTLLEPLLNAWYSVHPAADDLYRAALPRVR